MRLTPTLYLTRTGLLEPIGQSQVLAYLRGLASDHAITLISFERAADLADTERVARIEAICAAHDIRWLRLSYRQRPRVLASAVNLGQLVYHTWREARRRDVRLIHARAYIPAWAAWAVGRATGIPFIFDTRGLWPEELITAGRMRRGSLLHRLMLRGERLLLRDAGAVVQQTRACIPYLQATHPGALEEARLWVIRTCSDLARFRPDPEARTGAPRIGCHGSLASGWFRIDLLALVFDRLAVRCPEARFEILSREDPVELRRALTAALGKTPDWFDQLMIEAVPAHEIHTRLQAQSLSVFFYAAGAASELGRSPVRLGEALGCGVPVLANAAIGDVAEILSEGRVGHALQSEDDAALAQAVEAALALMADPDTPARCRAVAERHLALAPAIERYRALYHHLTGRECD